MGSTRYKAKRAPRTPDGGCSSVHEIVLHGIYSGISQEANTSPERLLTGCKDIGSALTAAREWHRVIAYVEQIVGLKTAFANYDLGFCALDGSALRKNAARRVQDPAIRRFIRDAWGEWFTMDNAVALWRTTAVDGLPLTSPILLKPEECVYTDAMGTEFLKSLRQFRPEDLRHLPASAQRRYQGGFVPDPDKGEGFAVLTRGRKGEGFAWPRLYRVQQCLAQMQGMEAGGALLGHVSRMMRLFHKVGWEPKTHVGAPVDVRLQYYSATRATAIKKEFGAKLGMVEGVVNFDHEIQLWTALAEEKAFDAKKWQDVFLRLLDWAGPIGRMLVAQGLQPFLSPLLKTQMLDEREQFADFIQEVLSEGWGIEARPVWGDRCFADTRIQTELIKSLIAAGAASQEAGLDEAGLDVETERARKQAEYDLAQDERTRGQVLPLNDPAHGGNPALDAVAGRTPGTPDPDTPA